MKKLSIKDITVIGMLSAICTIAIFIKIPYGNGAMVHLGTAAIFAIGITFGGVYAGLAGALGATIFDISSGFLTYTIWSFFIKGIAGFVVGTIANMGKGDKPRVTVVKAFVGCLAAAVVTLGGYLVAWSFVQGSFQSALANIPSSLISSGVGMVVGIPLGLTLKTALRKSGLLAKQVA